MWKNIVELGRSQMTIWCIRVECWIIKATDTRSYYVNNYCFPLQQWLDAGASMLALLIKLSAYT
jgi:hypothetical protein